MLPKIFLIFACFWCLIMPYNSLYELKKDMEKKVQTVALEIENILQKKCETKQFDCPVKSFNLCEGTGKRQCLTHFPSSSTCNGFSKYSLTSGARIPSSTASFDLSQQTKFNLCKTAEAPFESTLQKLINQNKKNFAWINIGFSDGSHRVSPGFKYDKEQTSQSCKNYDPRLRPWYSSNVYSRKKMIILVENSKRIYEHSTRNQSIKLSLQALLKTGDEGDYFNVIEFADFPRCLINSGLEQQLKLVSLESEIKDYDKKTGTQGLYYQAVANNISKSQSSVVNYKEALQMAVQILNNSRNDNPEYQNLILMFAGFEPSNFTSLDLQHDFYDYLHEKQKLLNFKITFFGFGVDMVDERGVQLLKNLSCSFGGIFFDISNIKYESMFLDQARGFYDFLSQGNQLNGYRWTSFYEDAFGLGRMTTVVRAAYYNQKNVTRLIGLAGIDVLVSQLTVYKSENDLRSDLSVTERPFRRNISLCALQTIRRKHRCFRAESIDCEYYEFCKSKIKTEVKLVMRSAEDISTESCCPLEEPSKVGLIIGLAIGVSLAIVLIILMVYCLIFRKPKNSQLEQTYTQIFAKFKDFDHSRIRADSDTSLIKE